MENITNKGAIFSTCRKYRYALLRSWSDDGDVMFIGLNPSTADETHDDPTIRRCVGYAKDWGFGGIYMLNLFAYKATEPKEMFKAENPIGDENDKWLKYFLNKTELAIACWGSWGGYSGRGEEVIKSLGVLNLWCLGMTKGNQPKHPLYLKRELKPSALKAFKIGKDSNVKVSNRKHLPYPGKESEIRTHGISHDPE